jgi:hypothetical protein
LEKGQSVSSKLEVMVGFTQSDGAVAGLHDCIEVTAINRETRPVTIIACVVFLPMGLRLPPDAPCIAYPLDLGAGAECVELFDCRNLAARAREYGYTGEVELDAAFLESGGMEESGMAPYMRRMTRGREHRTGPFVFNADRWQQAQL